MDYIIVGLGIAGLAFAETLLNNHKSFILIEDGEDGATVAAGGILNPTVLKRFTASWNVEQFAEYAIPFYKKLSIKFNQDIIEPIGIHRILNNVEEQNNWIVASDKEQLKPYLESSLIRNLNKSISAPFKIGAVKKGFQLQPRLLIEKFKNLLKEYDKLILENFDHKLLILNENAVVYKDYAAKYIVFAEGAKVAHNPIFPLSISPKTPKVFVGNKGEYIIIKSPQLKSEEVIKGPVMIIPLGDKLYKVGATYGRDDFTTDVTIDARQQIIDKLNTMITCDFEIVDQIAGIRPTVKDRKPLLGVLPSNRCIAFFNGLGTRGLTMAPLLAQQLFKFLDQDVQLPPEVNLQRFL